MFWESSALVPVIVPEPRSAELATAFDADVIPVTWWGTPLECQSALARKHREAPIPREVAMHAAERLRQIRVRAGEIAATEDVRARAFRLITIHRLRAADALQLSAALLWCEDNAAGETFVSLDRRLREAARHQGFTLLPAD